MTAIRVLLSDKFTEQDFPMVGFDPGLTTGMAWLDWLDFAEVEPGKIAWTLQLETERAVWPSEAGKIKGIIDGAGQTQVARTVIYEDFKLFKHKALQLSGDKLPAPRVIGWIEGLIQTRLKPVGTVYTTFSSLKTQYTNELLTGMFGPAVPRNRHERDAFRVLVKYLLEGKK